MNLDIGRALRIPFNQPRWFETILIGGLVWFVASIAAQIPHVGGLANMLVLAFTAGYCVKVMREETRATSSSLPARLPAWDNWKQLFTDGLLLTAAQFVYGAILTALFFLALLALGATAAVGEILNGNFSQLAPAVAFVFLLSMVAGGLLYALFLPMMAAHFAHEGRFGAAFELGTILRKMFARPLDVFLVVAVMIGLALLVLVSAITIVLIPLVMFFAQVVASNLWAQVYRLSGSR